MASIPIKLGSAIAAYALALGFSTAAGAAVHRGFIKGDNVPVRGTMTRKAAAVPAFTTLYSFDGLADGANPSGELLEDFNGNLFGTTQDGGVNGYGNVYEYTNGTVKTLHSFTGTDGSSPSGGLLNSIGNLDFGGNVYGVATNGGYNNNGVVYAVNQKTKAFSILHAFKGGLDGYNPYGRLILFRDGNIYGTTYSGGGYDKGLVFRITPKGAYNVVACFSGKNGANPIGGLAGSLKGFSINKSLFGTTTSGGKYGGGTVFAITVDKPKGTITNLHSLNPATDGAAPQAELIPDDSGNLYGTATTGGTGSAGTIFEISSAGWFTTLYSFPLDPINGNPNGAYPDARLASFLNGNLYGSTAYGGPSNSDAGVLFQFDGGTFTVLHSFDGTDGSQPLGQLLLSPDGNIYGTTLNGGNGTDGTLFAMPFPS